MGLEGSVRICMILKNLFLLQTLHKKTFYYLEQLILKHKLHQNALNIKEIHGRSMILYILFFMCVSVHVFEGRGLLYLLWPLTEFTLRSGETHLSPA